MELYERAAMKALMDNTTTENRRAPLDQWIDLLKDVSKDSNKAKDVATALKFISLFEKQTETKDINLKDCYEFLADVLMGKAPKQLDKSSMHFIMTCFSHLGRNLKDEDTKKEEEFINNLKLSDIMQKTYVNQNAPLIKDPALNALKIPANLLKIDK